AELECIEGRLYRGGRAHELVVGSDLARRLHLTVGQTLPPFYHSRRGDHNSQVVGIFRSDISMWQARLIVTSLESAGEIFDQPDLVTDLLIRCKPGYADEARRAIHRDIALPEAGGPVRARVVGREELAALLPEGPRQREGAFTARFV